jgi:type III pantothenate kinase
LFEVEHFHPYQYFESEETLAAICTRYLNEPHCRGILISSVSDPEHLIGLPQDSRVYILNGHMPLPFINQYQSLETLGADRIALVAAVVTLYPQTPVLVMDAGTCVTYDFVDGNTVYSGGAIAPGLNMRLQAMHQFTARLPMVAAEMPAPFPAATTASCLRAGAWHGLVYEAEGYVNSLLKDYCELKCLVTGGDAPLLVERLKCGIFADRFTLHENLVPIGLRTILLHLLKERTH